MKIIIPVLLISVTICACNNNEIKPTVTEKNMTEAVQRFFPVTEFIRGQLFTLDKKNDKFKKYITVNERTDSAFVQSGNLEKELIEFLHPVIDTTNLSSLFTEKSFMDQSINAVTLTYEAKTTLPDSMKLKRWDVYIDPEGNNIKRIYLVKEYSKNKTLQLTWVSNEWCKITSIVTDDIGISKVEKEEKIILVPDK